jgi:putative flippase GtrA
VAPPDISSRSRRALSDSARIRCVGGESDGGGCDRPSTPPASGAVVPLTALRRDLNSHTEPTHPQLGEKARPPVFPRTWANTLQVRRFVAVGVVNTFVDYVLFVALTKIMRLPLDWVWIAKLISGTVAISISFYLNRNWVFRATGTAIGQAARFVGTTVLGVYAIQTPLTQLFANSYPGLGKALYVVLRDTGLSGSFPSVFTEALAIKTAAFALATSVSMTFNFLLYRLWVFRVKASA